MAEKIANAFWTHLTAPMLVGDLTAHVALAAPAALQGGQFRVSIGSELCFVTSGESTTTWTVTRGIEGTTAEPHGGGTTVAHVLTAALPAEVVDARGGEATLGARLNTSAAAIVAGAAAVVAETARATAVENVMIAGAAGGWTTVPAEVVDARGGYATMGEKVRGGHFDVRDYGTAADWAAAANAAIAAMPTGGGVLDLPDEAYSTSAPIALKTGVRVTGGGRRMTRIKPSGNFAAFSITGAVVDWSISDLTIDYSDANGGNRCSNAGAVAIKLALSGSDYPYFFEIERVSVFYAFGAFESPNGPFMYGLRHVYASEIGGYGFTAGSGTTAVFQNCYANGALGGFSLTGIKGLQLLSCASDNCSGGDTNIVMTCRGLISGLDMEANTISGGRSLLNCSGSFLSIVAPATFGNVFATGAADEVYGIRASSGAELDIFEPELVNNTSTGTGSTYILICNADSRVSVSGGTVSAVAGTATNYGIAKGWGDYTSFVMGSGTPRYARGLDTTQVLIDGTKVIGTRVTGWAAATGTTSRTTFATSTVTTEELAKRVMALEEDLIAHGMIGA